MPKPIPPQLRDAVNAAISDVRNEDQRWKLRRLIEDAYVMGYADGHTAGHLEAGHDLRAPSRVTFTNSGD